MQIETRMSEKTLLAAKSIRSWALVEKGLGLDWDVDEILTQSSLKVEGEWVEAESETEG